MSGLYKKNECEAKASHRQENILALATAVAAATAAKGKDNGKQASASVVVCRIATTAAHKDKDPNQAIAGSCATTEVH